MKNTIVITGGAGFIGFHLSKLLSKENIVVGIDSMNSYYSVNLKKDRLDILKEKYSKNFFFKKLDLCDKNSLMNLFETYSFDYVINLAAQAGVRYSIEQPKSYINSNLLGFFNILELCRKFCTKNFIYASISSVYGANKKLPFSETDSVDHPVSLYAASKSQMK